MATSTKFDKELFNKLVLEHNANIINLIPEKITRTTIISFNCNTCKKIYSKSFRSIVKGTGFNCIDCSRKIGQDKLKKTNLEKYGVECVLKNRDILEKIKKTNIDKYGVDNVFKLESIKKSIKEKRYSQPKINKVKNVKEKIPRNIVYQKIKNTILKRYGVDHYSKTDSYKKKIIATYLRKYGVTHPSKTSEFKDKIKKTNLEKYGVECVLKNKDIIEKIKKTNIKKFGYEFSWQNSEIMNKTRNTILERYGVDHYSKTDKFLEKMKKTNIEKYGYSSYMQNPAMCELASKNSYKTKAIKTPSGNTIYLQGYEPQAYNILLNIYRENEIINDKRLVPEIWWTDSSGINHRYYTDFYIQKDNLCIEIKSNRTYSIDSNKIEKIKKCIEIIPKLYNYQIWILDKKGNIIDKQLYKKI